MKPQPPPPSKRQRLARLMMRSGSLELLVRARRRSGMPWLTVLTYHRVADPSEAGELDPDTIDATPAQFEAQIAYLAERYQFVGMDEVLDYLDGGRLPPNPVLITFDDGYVECLDCALPILERYGARATFFIATSFTDKREVMWWDKLSMLLARCHKERIHLDYPYPVTLDLAHDTSASGYLLGLVKTHYALDLPRFVREIERACEVHVDYEEERAIADRHLMTWDQIASLAEAGMDIGSHTSTHRVLQTLSPEQLGRELEGSRRLLEEKVHKPCRAIAYPVGYPLDGAERVRRALRNAGYRAGFSNNTGFNPPFTRPDPFDVRRVGMAVSFGEAYFRALCALPPFARNRREPPPLPAL